MMYVYPDSFDDKDSSSMKILNTIIDTHNEWKRTKGCNWSLLDIPWLSKNVLGATNLDGNVPVIAKKPRRKPKKSNTVSKVKPIKDRLATCRQKENRVLDVSKIKEESGVYLSRCFIRNNNQKTMDTKCISKIIPNLASDNDESWKAAAQVLLSESLLNNETYNDFLAEWSPPVKLPNTLHSRPKKNTKKQNVNDSEKNVKAKTEDVTSQVIDEQLDSNNPSDLNDDKQLSDKKESVNIDDIASGLTKTKKKKVKRSQPTLSMDDPPDLTKVQLMQ